MRLFFTFFFMKSSVGVGLRGKKLNFVFVIVLWDGWDGRDG